MNALIKVNTEAKSRHFHGMLGRVSDWDPRDKIYKVVLIGGKQKFGAPYSRFRANVIDFITNGKVLLKSDFLTLENWKHLNDTEKQGLIRDQIRNHPEYYEDFERHMQDEDSQLLFDFFIAKLIQKKKSHFHYSGKAIIEELRYYSQLKDGSVTLKINNNYTSSFGWLAIDLFPNELDGFLEDRRVQKQEKTKAA